MNVDWWITAIINDELSIINDQRWIINNQWYMKNSHHTDVEWTMNNQWSMMNDKWWIVNNVIRLYIVNPLTIVTPGTLKY